MNIEGDHFASESIGKLTDALAKAQREISDATKDSFNPNVSKPYADLRSVRAACKEPLAKNGLAVIQLPASSGDTASVATVLSHASGEYIGSRLTIKIDATKTSRINFAQAMGSAISYMRRYGYSGIVGVATADDDDGESAGNIVGEQSRGAHSHSQSHPTDRRATNTHEAKPTASAYDDFTNKRAEIVSDREIWPGGERQATDWLLKSHQPTDFGIKAWSEVKTANDEKVFVAILKALEIETERRLSSPNEMTREEI